MINKEEPTYDELRRKYTKEEIAESYVFRGSMSTAEKQEADEEFKRLRLEQLKSMSDDQVLQSELMRMKLLIKDYLDQSLFIEEFSFANQLKRYVSVAEKSMIEFSEDIGIHKTKLSRLVNNREKPNEELMYRLEHHSGGMIPATYWFRLFTRMQENAIKNNQEKRISEAKKVKNQLSFSSD
ncbi:MAG: hypothetical protein AAF741_12515 [Bacteroidota bacterium]